MPRRFEALALAPDGRAVYAKRGSFVEQVTLDDGKRLALPTTEFVSRMAVSPDGRWLACAGDSVTVYDLRADPPKPHQLAEARAGDPRAVAFSPDGRWLGSVDVACRYRVRSWA